MIYTSTIASHRALRATGFILDQGDSLGPLQASFSDQARTTSGLSYRIQAGDSWANIAQALYGSSGLDDELPESLSSPSLSVGAELIGLLEQLIDD